MSHLLPLRMAGKRALGTPEFTVERYAALCSLEEVAVAPPQSFATQTAGGWGLFLAASTGANEAQQLTNHETSWQIEAYDGAYARGWKAMFNACRGARAARILNKTSTFWIVDYAHQTPDPDPDHATEDLTENQLTEPAHGSFLEGHDGEPLLRPLAIESDPKRKSDGRPFFEERPMGRHRFSGLLDFKAGFAAGMDDALRLDLNRSVA